MKTINDLFTNYPDVEMKPVSREDDKIITSVKIAFIYNKKNCGTRCQIEIEKDDGVYNMQGMDSERLDERDIIKINTIIRSKVGEYTAADDNRENETKLD